MEKANERYDRDWLHVQDDRLDRTLLHQTEERKSRIYVTDGVSAVGKNPDDSNESARYEQLYSNEY